MGIGGPRDGLRPWLTPNYGARPPRGTGFGSRTSGGGRRPYIGNAPANLCERRPAPGSPATARLQAAVWEDGGSVPQDFGAGTKVIGGAPHPTSPRRGRGTAGGWGGPKNAAQRLRHFTASFVTLGLDPRGLHCATPPPVQSPRVRPEGDARWLGRHSAREPLQPANKNPPHSAGGTRWGVAGRLGPGLPDSAAPGLVYSAACARRGPGVALACAPNFSKLARKRPARCRAWRS